MIERKWTRFILGFVVWAYCSHSAVCGFGMAGGGADCDDRLSNCTLMVQPFLDDTRYMFPTTVRDIDGMCKVWSRFVECVTRFMSSCTTQDQRSKFQTAAENSINTVHAICSTDRFQKEYLENAECFKKVSVNDCGTYYRGMIEQVTNPYSQDEHICCAFSQFKQCASDLLVHQCNGRASKLMDTSMNFFASRCGKKFYSMSYRCPTAPPPLARNSLQRTSSLGAIPGAPLISTPATLTTTPYSWSARTVVYTLPPAFGSRTSTGDSGGTSFSGSYSSFLTTIGLFFIMGFRTIYL